MPKRQRIHSSSEQRHALRKLKERFAELGYLIFSVNEWYRGNPFDFIAAQKSAPAVFVVVRVRRKGVISVRPFASPALYTQVQKILAEIAPQVGVIIKWSNRQVPYARIKPNWWSYYIPHRELRELALFS